LGLVEAVRSISPVVGEGALATKVDITGGEEDSLPVRDSTDTEEESKDAGSFNY